MRKPEYLSPSALDVFEHSKEEYYLNYLAEDRPNRMPQTNAMSVGSAFDAYIKSYLHDRIYGKNHAESSKYELRTIFEAQVEPQHHAEAWTVGAYLFKAYQESGSLSDLMLELQGAVDDPRFEFTVTGAVAGKREAKIIGGDASKKDVILLGKPDIKFINAKGAHVIFDWKVNGFYSKSNTSPMAGYIALREQQPEGGWLNKIEHKEAYVSEFKGMKINIGGYLETWNKSWATQLACYGWLLGEPVGSENVVGIDQIVCNGANRLGPLNYPMLRIASHRTRISKAFQEDAHARFQALWDLLNEPAESFHFFKEFSIEESRAKCKQLDERAAMLRNLDPNSDEAAVLSWGRGSDW